MNPCFVCNTPTAGHRSLTQITAPPTGPHDAVPICAACHPDWSFALVGILRQDLAGLDVLANPKTDITTDPRKNNHPLP